MKLEAEIRKTNGKFFTVEFIKKDGTLRKLTGRLGVKKYLTGGVSTVAHKPEYITVYDVQNKGYRNVNLDTIKSFKCGAVVVSVAAL